MPLADLRQTIAMELNIFLNMPLDIVPEESSEEVRVALISEIKNAMNNKIADFITEKMWKNTEQSNRWTEA